MAFASYSYLEGQWIEKIITSTDYWTTSSAINTDGNHCAIIFDMMNTFGSTIPSIQTLFYKLNNGSWGQHKSLYTVATRLYTKSGFSEKLCLESGTLAYLVRRSTDSFKAVLVIKKIF